MIRLVTHMAKNAHVYVEMGKNYANSSEAVFNAIYVTFAIRFGFLFAKWSEVTFAQPF
ncbi:hypothetical protein K450DRAFT_259135 [Umbelopsis ramanniana AG]|uniref:Uncharacterized protein n=1 Tax=Umbelopsis ramanniana AG TaxID=1314678 RepID=A0AAD5E1J8_UMBRA|nr:uncharacterized protein K450DRAFT_259135 [Umbelopsis ramanniana AG]KAI8575953.1 hypothetical protein K450DRAFT_259135 [Umbelopsis ramanniana AG]